MQTKTALAVVKGTNDEKREVEQVVSAFNNVDSVGDRVREKAFVKSLDRWTTDGPMPAIFSHDWKNPEAILGPVLDAGELPPGHRLLTPKTADLGGLYIKYAIGERPFQDAVFQNLKAGLIRQASFAYDVIEQKFDEKSGVNDLIELDIIEVGPTLRGANTATDLISAKAMHEIKEALGANTHHPFLPSKEDTNLCAYPDCGRTARTNVHIERFASQEQPDHLKQLLTTISELTLNLKAIVEIYGEDITKLSKADEQTPVKADDETKSGSGTDTPFNAAQGWKDLAALL